MLFVDDRPNNLATARLLGMRTILFHSDDTDANPDPDEPGAEPGGVLTMAGLLAAIRHTVP